MNTLLAFSRWVDYFGHLFRFNFDLDSEFIPIFIEALKIDLLQYIYICTN